MANRDRPLLLGDDYDIIKEEQIVAPGAEGPPDAELLVDIGQLTTLLQPP